jgi:hypothetical protein
MMRPFACEGPVWLQRTKRTLESGTSCRLSVLFDKMSQESLLVVTHLFAQISKAAALRHAWIILLLLAGLSLLLLKGRTFSDDSATEEDSHSVPAFKIVEIAGRGKGAVASRDIQVSHGSNALLHPSSSDIYCTARGNVD